VTSACANIAPRTVTTAALIQVPGLGTGLGRLSWTGASSVAAPSSDGALSTEDRHASALTAVADLAAGLGIVAEAQEEILVPQSLEELEARLPFRD